MIAKTKKSLVKRFKVRKSGKIQHSTSGRAHFNARESGKVTRQKRHRSVLTKSFTKTVRQFTTSN